MHAAGDSPESGGTFTARLRRPDSFTISLALRERYDTVPRPAEEVLSRLAGCAGRGLAHGYFVSDRPAAPGEPPAGTLATWVLDHGGMPIVSLSLAGEGRAESFERARALARGGVRNLLVVTGDHPAPGGRGEPVFDLDSVQMLMLLGAARERGDGCPADLAAGCVVSPAKTLEAEVMWQYAKLRRKVALGAGFILAQAAYDPRAWDELIRFCRLESLAPPVIGSVLVPDAELSRRIAAGALPGVSIPAALLARFSSPEPREGLLLAAAAVAVLRGLGYQGALLGGRPLSPDEVGFILEEAERLSPRWEECLDAFGPPPPRFAYFRKDERTGLNEDRPAEVPSRAFPHPMYVFSRAIDHVAFGPVEPVFRLLTRVCRFCEPRPFWRRALWCLEYLSKVPLYRCRMCGDCTLYACGFFCSESGCPKRMVNGPCGGSCEGRCEVFPKKTCMWVKAYDCLKTRAERPAFTAPPVPPKDRGLEGTCSWINYCLGRDHRKLPQA